ncbi:CASP8 and FADD-like apoptosis regulator isoform X2 [Rhineura floridana]|uniref:CASP8 and FADD-like apoptosis regulator isoform X2 n=1 Tax=Rhineura floridana TaxID=261503 RepID=UPI002AC8017D|nr:CASP8 and FADD-like apoptosis regulator isoform X2 [Rhineura floridana]
MTWLFCLNNAEDFLKGQWLVMTVYRVPAALLHQIEQELDAEEKETMLFLCRDLVPDLPAANVRKLLVALNEREMLTPVSLSELLYRMKRFDLLKKVLGTGRTAVEASLPRCPQMLSKYRVLMTEINEDLDKEDLSSLVFLLMNDLGTSHVKAAKEKNFLAIITDLEKLDLVSPNCLDLIETCFLNMRRKDLAKKIQKYKQEAPGQPIGSPPVYANRLQVVNKGRLTNGACAIQAEQIHISVPETGGAQAQVSNKYRMQSQPLGVCLIIDCIGNDAGMLTVTFKALCFEVRCCLFPNVDSLVRELYEVARLKQHKDYDCFVCILVSRGNHQGIFCTNPIVPGFSLERLKNFFTGDACPYLSGKPKLFFIQNYVEPGTWQENPSLLEADGDLCTIPQGADVLWSLSMLNASNMERSQSSSSYYLSALTELLIDPHKRKLHLLDILVELNSKIYEWNRTNPRDQYSVLLKHTLRKKLFLSVS